MAKICFDYGHGGRDPGAVYKGRKEAADNLRLGSDVAKTLRKRGIEVDETRRFEQTVSLKERSDFERKGSYDYFISFHRNAYKAGQANGAEVFVHKGSGRALALAHELMDFLAELGFKKRGIKEANFHVLRETRSPAILMEIGFIDNSKDNALFDKKYDSMVSGLARVIGDHLLGKSSTSQVDKEIFYRVVAGSYQKKDNAEKQLEKLKQAGFDGFLLRSKI